MDLDKKLRELVGLEGKVAVITGAASGIGFGTARFLAEMGATISLLDIDSDKGLMAESDICKSGGRAKYFKCDVTSNPDCKALCTTRVFLLWIPAVTLVDGSPYPLIYEVFLRTDTTLARRSDDLREPPKGR